MTQKQKSSYSDRNAERLAKVLRENLKKRRQQKNEESKQEKQED
jgi:hypothetical protein